jgi:hypothetical protein
VGTMAVVVLTTEDDQAVVCGVAFVKGKICCMKICLFMDFYGSAVPMPAACAPDGSQATCD